MRIEVLFIDGCPNHEAMLPHLHRLLATVGADHAEIELVRVEDDDDAAAERFLGSPTVRIDGEDVEPGADERTDFGLKCRLFTTPDGLRGLPDDDWIVRAVERVSTASTTPSCTAIQGWVASDKRAKEVVPCAGRRSFSPPPCSRDSSPPHLHRHRTTPPRA